MTEEQFNELEWPEEFYIEFSDGARQLFVSSQGVIWDSGAAEDGENAGRASISCCWQKKSTSQNRYRSIQVWVDEVLSIHSKDGELLWTSAK